MIKRIVLTWVSNGTLSVTLTFLSSSSTAGQKVNNNTEPGFIEKDKNRSTTIWLHLNWFCTCAGTKVQSTLSQLFCILILWKFHKGKKTFISMSLKPDKHHGTEAFRQIGVQASCGWPLAIENYFIFHMLHYKSLIWVGPIAHFGWALLAKRWWYIIASEIAEKTHNNLKVQWCEYDLHVYHCTKTKKWKLNS